MLTLNQIVRRIKTIALAQAQVRNFYYGSVTDFLTDKTTRYASCFLQDLPGNFDVVGKIVTFNFRMFLLDLENVSEDTQKNTLDCQSDMAQICTDLLAEFDFSDYMDWRIGATSNFNLVREELDDIVAGCTVDISVQIPYNKDTCAIPGAEVSELALYWSWFVSDPYGDIQDMEFLFTRLITDQQSGYSLDFETIEQVYLAVKENFDQPLKNTWFNTTFNNGAFPDQVFRDPVIIGSYRYYVSRIPVVIDSTNSTFIFHV